MARHRILTNPYKLTLYLEKDLVTFGKNFASSQKTSINQVVNRWLLELMGSGEIHYKPIPDKFLLKKKVSSKKKNY